MFDICPVLPTYLNRMAFMPSCFCSSSLKRCSRLQLLIELSKGYDAGYNFFAALAKQLYTVLAHLISCHTGIVKHLKVLPGQTESCCIQFQPKAYEQSLYIGTHVLYSQVDRLNLRRKNNSPINKLMNSKIGRMIALTKLYKTAYPANSE